MTEEPLCNLCGLSCALNSRESEVAGLIDAVAVGGYGSTPGNGFGALDDFVAYRFNLCEFCLDWLFGRFVVPVIVEDAMGDHSLLEGETVEEGVLRMGIVTFGPRSEPPPWRPAAQRIAEDAWRKRDDFTVETTRRARARKENVPFKKP